MKIIKSSRHTKITGDFGEALVLYWLSKYGFECALVDHTGMDIIARNPHTGEVMGISVKSRCRSEGTETNNVRTTTDDFQKLKLACQSFGCMPYLAIVVDAHDVIRGFILRLEHLLALSPMARSSASWRMTQKALDAYKQDSKIIRFEMQTKTHMWWSGEQSAAANG